MNNADAGHPSTPKGNLPYKPDHSCGLGCLGFLVLCGIIAGISTIFTACQSSQPSPPSSKTEYSAETYCEKEIARGVQNVLNQRGDIQYKHLGVGILGNEYKVTSVVNVEGIASGNRQSRWICRIEWTESSKTWKTLGVTTTG